MKIKLGTQVFAAVALGASAWLVGCADAGVEQEAPSADVDVLESADEGSSYNGWTQYTDLRLVCGAFIDYTHTFARTSGDATRGGGACLVYPTGATCSGDATCTTAAKAAHGASAYGYCYAGSCYSRPGSPAANCTLNSNRAPGTIGGIDTTGYFNASNARGIGCMTKAAGPSTACGGTNSALYMRNLGVITSSSCF